MELKFSANQVISCHLRLIYVSIFRQTASILNSVHPTVHCSHGIHYCCRSTIFWIRCICVWKRNPFLPFLPLIKQGKNATKTIMLTDKVWCVVDKKSYTSENEQTIHTDQTNICIMNAVPKNLTTLLLTVKSELSRDSNRQLHPTNTPHCH